MFYIAFLYILEANCKNTQSTVDITWQHSVKAHLFLFFFIMSQDRSPVMKIHAGFGVEI